ncbi:hypothetical protein N8766_00700 [bacterium]|nr:hypothetical protein [bacterium]
MRYREATEATWLEILRSDDHYVRIVTLNKTLPESILRHLSRHGSSEVRVDIANRRGLPVDVFETLALDVDESVRARIAWNKKTPAEVLKQLASDTESIVSEPALKRLSQLGLN